jgi:hypothetical protein
MTNISQAINIVDVLNRMASENMPEILRKVNQKFCEGCSEYRARISEEGEVVVDDGNDGRWGIDLGVMTRGEDELREYPIWCVLRWDNEIRGDVVGGQCLFQAESIDDVVTKFVEIVTL